MRTLKLKEVAEMTLRYSQDHHVDLLTAFKEVSSVLADASNYDFETVKQFLFKANFNKK